MTLTLIMSQQMFTSESFFSGPDVGVFSIFTVFIFSFEAKVITGTSRLATLVSYLNRQNCVNCGCHSKLWVSLHTVGVTPNCGCHSKMWVSRHTVGVTPNCGCHSILWVSLQTVGVTPYWECHSTYIVCNDITRLVYYVNL